MISGLGELEWGVPLCGFRWIKSPPPQIVEFCSTTGSFSGSEAELKWSLKVDSDKPSVDYEGFDQVLNEHGYYNPYEIDPPLFRIFSNTEPSRKGILEFANKYGLLGTRPGRPRTVELPEIVPRKNPLESTQLFWSRHISRMKELLILVDLCDRGDEDGLSELIRWGNRREKVSYLTPSTGRFAEGKSPVEREVIIAREKTDLDWNDNPVFEYFARFTPGDPILPALTHVQSEVNKRIEDGISPRLLWDKDGRLGLRQVPSTLLQMLWLQFADSVAANFAYRACPACGRWVRIGPDASRKSRLYCSDACRTRVHRERQAEARRLHSEGKAIPTIATELGCDPDAVARWVKQDEGSD